MNDDLYSWPNLLPDEAHASEQDLFFASWAYKVRAELNPVYDTMSRAMPDDPRQMDALVTQVIEGWASRVSSLATRAEFFLNDAKARHWPPPVDIEGNKLTVADREVLFDSRLAPYRFVRDELDVLSKRMIDRMRWAQSVRKVQEASNF